MRVIQKILPNPLNMEINRISCKGYPVPGWGIIIISKYFGAYKFTNTAEKEYEIKNQMRLNKKSRYENQKIALTS